MHALPAWAAASPWFPVEQAAAQASLVHTGVLAMSQPCKTFVSQDANERHLAGSLKDDFIWHMVLPGKAKNSS